MAVSLPLAILAGCLMISISELGYVKTSQLLTNMTRANDIRTSINVLHRDILNAETGLRGYLLTNNQEYLAPYYSAHKNIDSTLEEIREKLDPSRVNMDIYVPLARNINRKMAEMDLSLKLFQEGNSEALKFVMFTDMGNSDMEQIRTLSNQLDANILQEMESFQQELQSSLTWARIGIVVFTIIGLLAFYVFLRQQQLVERLHMREQALQSEERNRLEQLVRERTATLTELANHLQQVREDERGHLARELHDELGALLTAAKLDVARLKSKIEMSHPEVADRVKHLTETLNSGIALKRRIVEDLRPSSLSNLGLATSLEILTNEFAQRIGIPVEANLEAVDLPDATELTIYRLVQESLTNIGKYAKANNIEVSVHNYPTYVAVQIQDDGEGFELSSIRPNSHGLAGMRHRVEAAGGRLTINSAVGEGTTISAVIPTTANAHEVMATA